MTLSELAMICQGSRSSPSDDNADKEQHIKVRVIFISPVYPTAMFSLLLSSQLVMPFASSEDDRRDSESDDNERRRRNRAIQQKHYYKRKYQGDQLKEDLENLAKERDELHHMLTVQQMETEEYAKFLRERDCPYHTPNEAFMSVGLAALNSRQPEEPVVGQSTVDRTPQQTRLEKSRRFRNKVKTLEKEIADMVDEVAKLKMDIEACEERHLKLLKLAADCEKSCDKLELKDFNELCVDVIVRDRYL